MLLDLRMCYHPFLSPIPLYVGDIPSILQEGPKEIKKKNEEEYIYYRLDILFSIIYGYIYACFI